MRTWIRSLAIVVALTLAASGTSFADPIPTTARIGEALRTRLEAFPNSAEVGGHPLLARTLLREFYGSRGFQPAWITDGVPRGDAHELLATVDRAGEHGLHPNDYHAQDLHERLDASLAGQATVPELVDLELLLTDAFFVYGSHLLRGKTDPELLHPDWKASRRTTRLPERLEQALAESRVRETLAGLAPSYPEYRRLQASLLRYESGNRASPAEFASAESHAIPVEDPNTEWITVAEGGKLEPGGQDDRVPALRARLRAEGYRVGPEVMEPRIYDDSLAVAVREFQRRNGLDADGVVGTRTVQALARTLPSSLDRIRANLERWRWLPDALGAHHIRVNIAAFSVQVWDEGQVSLTIPCIVGKTARKSPVFSANMSYLVLNPTWTVPPRILLQDKLPLIRKNPGYLTENGFEVLEGWGADARRVDPTTIDWSQVGSGNMPYRLRQKPGERTRWDASSSCSRIPTMSTSRYALA
ncbi:MAG: L,D-transpeptidase family protein [Candidatus Eisenbacteria bacterium]